jgi:hypothetical protein
MLARGIPGESLESASLPPRNHLDHGPKRSSCPKGLETLQICHLKIPKPSSFPTGETKFKNSKWLNCVACIISQAAKAASELDVFIARRPVDCSPVNLDQYRRTVAVCSIDGVDLADWLVRNGLALDWPTYSKGKYGGAQRDAEHATCRARRLGQRYILCLDIPCRLLSPRR